MKKITLLLVLVLCLTFIGCGRIYGPVEEVKAFVNEKDDVILQMGKKIEANPTEAGVDEARKIFEARKDGLKAKKEAIKAAPQGMNGDWLTTLYNSEASDPKMLDAIRDKLVKAGAVGAATDKFSALRKDFEATVKRY